MIIMLSISLLIIQSLTACVQSTLGVTSGASQVLLAGVSGIYSGGSHVFAQPIDGVVSICLNQPCKGEMDIRQ